MPNWCSNVVVVDGKKREIARFVKYVVDPSTEAAFSFQTILSMPEELQGTVSPATIVTQEEYDAVSYKTYQGFDVGKPITQRMSDRFIKQYGVDNWLDWANDNWGTKWDVASDEIETSLEPTHLVYKFDTAWGPPNGIYEELVNQFPKLTIAWHYHEPDMEVFGNLATDNLRNRTASRELDKKIGGILRGLQKAV